MSVRFYSDDESDDGEERDAFNEIQISGRESVVFAIDCCKEMFEGEDGNAPFNKVASAIHDMMLNKIITSDKDLHGVILFGTEKHKNSGDFAGIYEWMNFDVPCVQSICDLREIQDITSKKFTEEFGMKSDYQMSDVLWACLNVFSGTTLKLASKTLILFTWDDEPHFGDDNARKRTKAKATDLHDHGVDVQVLSFNKNFKYDGFYKEIISDPQSLEYSSIENPLDGIQNLYSYLLRKCVKQRTITRVPLQLGGGVELYVGVYTVCRRTTKSAAINIDGKTNQEVRRHASLVDTNTGEVLMPSDVKLQQTWAGQSIVLEKEEVKNMRKLSDQGLTLLGFKPTSKVIKPWHHVRNSQFIYPDEKYIEGSTTLFTALLKKCLEKDVVAICSYALRSGSPPRSVALLPQAEKTDPETSEQIEPPGFYIIFLPFADDLRQIEIERQLPEPSVEQIQAAEVMAKRLKFSYNPENFDNPAIQTHYKALEAMALDKEKPDAIDDHTIPDYDTIEKKAGSLIRSFKELVYPPDYKPNQPSKRPSRKQESMEVDVEEYAANNKLGRLTVSALKQICQQYNIKCKGKKSDIVKSIEDHFK